MGLQAVLSIGLGSAFAAWVVPPCDQSMSELTFSAALLSSLQFGLILSPTPSCWRRSSRFRAENRLCYLIRLTKVCLAYLNRRLSSLLTPLLYHSPILLTCLSAYR